jgi:hypothetical protein
MDEKGNNEIRKCCLCIDSIEGERTGANGRQSKVTNMP